MMSLMQLRFGAAGLACALAAAAGLLLPPSPTAARLTGQSRALNPLDGPDGADVETLVQRLGQTNLFPAAQTLAALNGDAIDPDAPDPAASDGLAAAIAARLPDIRALVRRESEWRIHASGEANLVDIFVPGEELFDGWMIAEISPRTLLLERHGEIRTIDVFVPNNVGQ
ncbi:hypothetical protein [Maricaulis maris]|uniref:hypothetical protein n=1 Tax=Maricaulis maris TaxID=74318 RepID=UPI0030C6B43B